MGKGGQAEKRKSGRTFRTPSLCRAICVHLGSTAVNLPLYFAPRISFVFRISIFTSASVVPHFRVAMHKCLLPRICVVAQYACMNFRAKWVGWDELPRWREDFRRTGKRLVVTNGCFDLLHLGHVTYLESARALGDALLIGVNSDESVRQLKGEGRPVNCETDRALVLAALESVGAVCIYGDKSATRFLERAQPDVYVKGGDYTLDTLNQEERRLVEAIGGTIAILPVVQGRSTTTTLAKIARL
jgi:rfaE bifunctional protein nucleotidyltransferase chain/domain